MESEARENRVVERDGAKREPARASRDAVFLKAQTLWKTDGSIVSQLSPVFDFLCCWPPTVATVSSLSRLAGMPVFANRGGAGKAKARVRLAGGCVIAEAASVCLKS